MKVKILLGIPMCSIVIIRAIDTFTGFPHSEWRLNLPTHLKLDMVMWLILANGMWPSVSLPFSNTLVTTVFNQCHQTSMIWQQVMSFLDGSVCKESACSTKDAGDPDSTSGFGRPSWGRKWQPTPVFLPGESHGQRSLAAYSPKGCKESDKIEQLSMKHLHFLLPFFDFLMKLNHFMLKVYSYPFVN